MTQKLKLPIARTWNSEPGGIHTYVENALKPNTFLAFNVFNS